MQSLLGLASTTILCLLSHTKSLSIRPTRHAALQNSLFHKFHPSLVSPTFINFASSRTPQMRSKSQIGVDAATNPELDTAVGEQSDAFSDLTVLGICGSIGSGKSFVSRLLISKLNQLESKSSAENTQQRYHIVTDSLAHKVDEPGSPAIKEIEELFGSEVVGEDGTIDRKALGRIVFSDASQMKVSEYI